MPIYGTINNNGVTENYVCFNSTLTSHELNAVTSHLIGLSKTGLTIFNNNQKSLKILPVFLSSNRYAQGNFDIWVIV